MNACLCACVCVWSIVLCCRVLNNKNVNEFEWHFIVCVSGTFYLFYVYAHIHSGARYMQLACMRARKCLYTRVYTPSCVCVYGCEWMCSPMYVLTRAVFVVVCVHSVLTWLYISHATGCALNFKFIIIFSLTRCSSHLSTNNKKKTHKSGLHLMPITQFNFCTDICNALNVRHSIANILIDTKL